VETFLHLGKSDHARVLLGFGVSVIDFKSLLHDFCNFLDLTIVERLQDVGFEGCFLIFWLLGYLLVAFEEHLHSVDSKGDEFLPGDFAVGVLISESQESAQIMLTQVVVLQLLEGIIEFMVAEFPRFFNISFLQDSN